MKPCSNNRKHITWLTMGALDARQERDLRAHVKTCEGCRSYLEEISRVTEELSDAEISSDILASESFHKNVMRRLKAQETVSTWDTLLGNARAILVNWRVGLSAIGAAALIVGAVLIVLRPPVSSPRVSSIARTVTAAPSKVDPAPSLATYQMLANRSLDKLDELLTREGNKNPSPAPIYTASALSLVSASE